MDMSGIVTLTTDFGTRDPYAGIMKGMVLSTHPGAKLVDITHEIPPHDIFNAAFTLARSFEYFPPGTVHVAVVDPLVGEKRKNIAILTERYIFVGPDNGIFTMALHKEKLVAKREILNPPFVLERISNTFHGRDVFAPCAGFLSAGRDFSAVGPEVATIISLKFPRSSHDGMILKGEIVFVDSFGNMITNISEQTFRSFTGKQPFGIYFAMDRFTEIHRHYSDVPAGSLLALFGSSGHLEISINSGSAEGYFMSPVGSTVTVRRF